MKKVVLLSIGGVAIVTTIILWWMYLNSPKHSLKELGEAFNNHDYTTFEKYVDVGSVTNELLDVFQEEEGDKKSEGLVELMRGKFVEVATTQIKKLVENPNFDENEKKEIENNKYFSLLWEKKIVKEITDVRKDGKIAYVDIMLNINKADTILPITAKMRDVGNNWQLFGFEDLGDFFKEIETLKEQKLERLNKGITSQIYSSIKYEGAGFSLYPDQRQNKYIFYVRMLLRNLSEKNIKEYTTVLRILDKDENVVGTLNCLFEWEKGEFKPNEKVDKTINFYIEPRYTQFVNGLNTLIENQKSKADDLNFTLGEPTLTFEGGKELKPLTKKDL